MAAVESPTNETVNEPHAIRMNKRGTVQPSQNIQYQDRRAGAAIPRT
jgi:hypothetical protein